MIALYLNYPTKWENVGKNVHSEKSKVVWFRHIIYLQGILVSKARGIQPNKLIIPILD